MRTLFTFAFAVVCVGLANWLTMQSWGGAVYVYVGEQRAPASVRSVTDYSAIDRRALARSVHEQLVAGAQAIKRDGSVGIRLGHPLVPRSEGGGREFACEISGHNPAYHRVELTFYGTGVTVAGEPPLMVVDTSCRATGQLDALDTVWIPIDEIVATGAKDQDLQTEGEDPMFIRLQNMPGEWPVHWVLYSVRFYRSDNHEHELLIDAASLRAASEQMLSF